MDAATGVITTVAGTGEIRASAATAGPGTAAQLVPSPWGVALDGAGNLFIADTENHRVRRVDATTGVITTVAGTGETGLSPATGARPRRRRLWTAPAVWCWTGPGNLFIADADNNRVRRVAAVAVPVTARPGIGPGR